MPFAKSEILNMTFDEMRRVKLHVSKEQNKYPQGSERWNSAETLRLHVESREDVLEKKFIADEKMNGAEFRRCTSCCKDKPVKDHPYGYLFRIGRKVTICKRCARNDKKEYHANNLEAGRARAAYHQNHRSALGSIADADKVLVRKLQKNKCAYCGEDLKGGGEFDHFIPADYGGSNAIDNRVLACTTCNRNKGRKMPDEFLRWRKLLNFCIRPGGFYEPHMNMVAISHGK